MDCLETYEIKQVQSMKSHLDSGSYASVNMVHVNGMPCIQKRLHDILLGLGGTESVSGDQQKSIMEKFYIECKLLWKMRHPNIVQFLGIHYYGRASEKKLSLIMEYLPTCVEKCITKCNNTKYVIPFSIKLSILRDVTYGLSHLHANNIIHRDLSAANILLTTCLSAKIADLGVSKLVDSSSMKFTIAPGAQYIMPPEAMIGNPIYTDKLDIFSFGILTLYLMLQKLPLADDSKVNVEHAINKQKAIGKRAPYIDQLRTMNVIVAEIVTRCLMDKQDSRPNAAKLNDDIASCSRRIKLDFSSDLISFIKSVGKQVLVS